MKKLENLLLEYLEKVEPKRNKNFWGIAILFTLFIFAFIGLLCASVLMLALNYIPLWIGICMVIIISLFVITLLLLMFNYFNDED